MRSFDHKLGFALEGLDRTKPGYDLADPTHLRCRKCKLPFSRNELRDGVCQSCVIGEANMMDTGVSALGGQYPGGPSDNRTSPMDAMSAADKSDLEAMEYEDKKDEMQQQEPGEAEMSKWQPLQQKFQQLQQQQEKTKSKFDSTKDPRDAEEMVRLSDQTDAAKQAYERTRWPETPPAGTAI